MRAGRETGSYVARLLVGIIVAASMIHLAITNLAACVALLVPITMTIAHGAGINLIVCAR